MDPSILPRRVRHRVPHQIGSADSQAAELLTLFSAQGERAHLSPWPTSPT
ncbi:hypothetical protein [Micromonospora carbonacea]